MTTLVIRLQINFATIREAIQKNKEYQKGKDPNLLGPPPPLIRKKIGNYFSLLDPLPPP